MSLRCATAALALAACGSNPGSSMFADAVRRTCALATSCLKSSPFGSGAQCVADLEFGIVSGLGFFSASAADLNRYVSCAEMASDCTSALDCASRHHGPDYCSAHPGTTCDGDLRVQCPSTGSPPDWAIYTMDCSSLGLRCMAALGSASCTDGTTCDPSKAALCNESQIISCNSETHLRFMVDCATYIAGFTCQDGSANAPAAGCVPAGPPCQSPNDRCDGAVLVACVANHELRVDCTKFQSHCDANAKACVPDSSDCSPTSLDQCSVGALEICTNGRYAPTDCASIGLRTCQLL